MTSVIRRRHVDGAPRVVLARPDLLFSDDFHDGWKWGFQSLGCEVIETDLSTIKTLALHNTSPYAVPANNRNAKAVAMEVLRHNPDLVFCHHGRAAANSTFQYEIRRRGIPTAVYLCDEPYECGETLQYSQRFDYVFTMDPGTLSAHRKAKGSRDQVYYLPPGVNTDRFHLWSYKKRSDPHARVFFLGNASLKPRPEFFEPVERIIDGVRICYWKNTNKKANKDRWLGLSEHPELFANCLVGINVHRDPRIGRREYLDYVIKKGNKYPRWPGLEVMKAPPPEWGGTGFWNVYDLPARHINPRFFEMAACGTCVINDDSRSELARLFPVAPRAENPEHFLDLVRYYLDRPSEAEEVGQECFSLISKRHTYKHRAAEILLRVGLKASTADSLFSSLGEPAEWLSTQDFDELGITQSLEQTGRFGPYDRRTGRSLTRKFGSPNAGSSLRTVPPWSF